MHWACQRSTHRDTRAKSAFVAVSPSRDSGAPSIALILRAGVSEASITSLASLPHSMTIGRLLLTLGDQRRLIGFDAGVRRRAFDLGP